MTSLLGIYLNDHLAGATAGLELARRTASGQKSRASGGRLADIAREITEDRNALIDIMGALDVPVRHYKVYAGWTAEKLGRLKLNGRLTDRSPLSDLIELESLRLGVEGKLALWRTLQALEAVRVRVPASRLDELIARAEQQIATLEQLRMATGQDIFASS